MDDLDLLFRLIDEHRWIAVAGFGVGAVMRLLKTESVAAALPIPRRYRPAMAVGLGVLLGALDHVTGGASLPMALLKGALSGGLAICGHDILIEGLRGGREVFERQQ